MKAIGVVRKMDELGRYVLPMEIRRSLNIREGDGLEIFIDGESILLKKHEPRENDMAEDMNWIDIATMILEGARWNATEEEIATLAQRMQKLNDRGLSKLNKRLIDGGNNTRDTLAELNFCCELIEHNQSNVPILYEPHEFGGRTLTRPPDFVIRKDDITFWIQMKNLSVTERDNRRENDIKLIKEQAQAIKVNKFFWCNLSEDFNRSDIKPLIDFITSVAADSIDDKNYLYPSKDSVKAEISFWKPNNAVIKCLTLGGSGDLDVIDVTGESSIHIRSSLINAAGAFTWDTDDKNINLIAMEMGKGIHDNIDIGEAVYGDESIIYNTIGNHGWRRDNNGFFYNTDFCTKVAGIVVVKRKEHLPFSKYNKLLFINERFRNKIEEISLILDFDRVIYFNNIIDDD